MGAHLIEVRDVTDVVAYPVVIDVLVDLFLAGKFFSNLESFPDRAGVVATAADVVDLVLGLGPVDLGL